jgi:hypothetical protein
MGLHVFHTSSYSHVERDDRYNDCIGLVPNNIYSFYSLLLLTRYEWQTTVRAENDDERDAATGIAVTVNRCLDEYVAATNNNRVIGAKFQVTYTCMSLTRSLTHSLTHSVTQPLSTHWQQ